MENTPGGGCNHALFAVRAGCAIALPGEEDVLRLLSPLP